MDTNNRDLYSIMTAVRGFAGGIRTLYDLIRIDAPDTKYKGR
jgi:hypothetical protein